MAAPIMVGSPDKKVIIRFKLQPDGSPAYRVDYLGKPIVMESEMGLEPGFLEGFKLIEKTTAKFSCSWTNMYGELRTVPNNYNELDVDLQNPLGQMMRITFRAYDEGAAFRYSFPGQATNNFHFIGERTEFRFPEGTLGYEEHGTEGEYHCVLVKDIQPECERPLTVKYTYGLFASLCEADNEHYPRMLLSPLPGIPGSIISALGGTTSNTTLARDMMREDPTAILHGGDSTPWRVFVVGQKQGDLLERNYIVLDLCPSCALQDTSWIKPGKVMRDMTLTTSNSEAIVDFAAVANLQYVELDWHWYGRDQTYETGDASTVRAQNLDLPKVIQYAKKKNVGVILYVDRKQIKKQRDILFPLYEKWGVAGVKIGFIDVGPQSETAWVTETIQKAAEHHLVLDIHDGYRPTGLTRTWPNLLTVEGIRGNEHMPTSEHNCSLPFTRYVAGAADYTVCYYTKLKQTTFAHQLAMAVISFSPLQFILWYDSPSDYQGEKEVEFFRDIPTVWDETRVLNGEIGKYATVARRSGEDWFIGTINDSEPRELKLALFFLDKKRKYQVQIYSDDPLLSTRTHVASIIKQVDARTVLDVPLLSAGGQAMRITPILDQ